MILYIVYPNIHEYSSDCQHSSTAHGVYNILMRCGYSHEDAANAEGWCELAAVGETYEHGDCYIEVVECV